MALSLLTAPPPSPGRRTDRRAGIRELCEARGPGYVVTEADVRAVTQVSGAWGVAGQQDTLTVSDSESRNPACSRVGLKHPGGWLLGGKRAWQGLE